MVLQSSNWMDAELEWAGAGEVMGIGKRGNGEEYRREERRGEKGTTPVTNVLEMLFTRAHGVLGAAELDVRIAGRAPHRIDEEQNPVWHDAQACPPPTARNPPANQNQPMQRHTRGSPTVVCTQPETRPARLPVPTARANRPETRS